MKILDVIHSAISRAATGFAAAWHTDIEPWLRDFLGSVVHAEVDTIIPIAREFVAQAVPALVTAAKDGNWQGFADAQWDAVVNTATAAQAQAVNVAITSVATAVNALIVGHPDVAAAAAGAPIGSTAPAQ